MTGASSSLVGGTITNSATISGIGTVAAGVNSSGTLEAIGGTLVFAGAVTNTGTLRTAAGSKLLVSPAGSFSTNAGLMDLAGGTFDNGNHTLNNTGTIAGYGVFSSGGLTNNANITFAGGTATINGPVTNNTTIKVDHAPAIFTGPVTNAAGSLIKTYSTTVTFVSTFNNAGTFTPDPTTSVFQSIVTSSGTMTGSATDTYIMSGGTFTNSASFISAGPLQSSDNTTNSGTFTQSGPQTWSNGTTFSNTGGTATFASDTGSSSTSPLNIIITAGTVNLSATQHLGALTVTTGIAAITTGTTKTNSLILGGSTNNWTGNLSLSNNKLIVEATLATKAATLNALQNEAFYGQTHTTGITSNALAANLALAVIDNGALTTPFSIFGGVAVDTNSILLAPELLGDSNIDGHVDLNDLNTVLNNLGVANTSWTTGNFDGAPTIDLNDLNDVLNNLGTTYANSSSVIAAEGLLGATPAITPEPASLSLVLVAIPVFLRKRRRD